MDQKDTWAKHVTSPPVLVLISVENTEFTSIGIPDVETEAFKF